MAVKAMLFLFAYVLLVTTRVSSLTEDENVTEHAKAPVKAPAHALVKAPVHPPKKAPAHAPEKPLHHPPIKAPVHSSVKAPAHPPVPPVAPKHGCVPMCEEHCKNHHHNKKTCMKECTACCREFKCVPGFMKCSNWGHVKIHDVIVKCP